MNVVDSEKVAQIFNALKSSLQCGICYSHLINPTTITDCGHTFCSLCIKGIIGANKNSRCPYCSEGTFSRRKGTFLDSKVSELLRYVERLNCPKESEGKKVTTSKTDGFLIQGPKLGVTKKTASRKRRGRATFSLESNTEDVFQLKSDQLDINHFMESQHSDHGNNIVSVSLLEDEDVNIASPKDDSTPTDKTFSKTVLLPNKGEKEKNTNFYPNGLTSRITEPRSKVANFFKRGSILPDKLPRRKVCAFNQLGSLLPHVASNLESKYPSIDSILARKHENKTFKSPSTPLAKEDPSTPLFSHRRSSEKSFKHHYHRRLINDSYSAFKSNNSLRDEEETIKDKYGSFRRLSKEKIIGAQPLTQTSNQTKTKDDYTQREVLKEMIPSVNVEMAVEKPDENEDDDLPTGPISLKKIDSNSQNRTPSLSQKSAQNHDTSDIEDGQSTQEMVQKLMKLKEQAALLHQKIESEKKIPPSDEEDEIFLSTPETLPKKKKRPPIGYPSSARKKLKVNTDEGNGGYVFPSGTKVMVSALQTDYDSSCYRKFCEIYEGQATFLSGDFDESINILILSTVNDEDLRCNRTVKYLFALASGSLQNPVSYIVKDFSGFNGPQRSFQRNENTPPLFSQFEFGLIGEFDSDFDEEKLAKLIQLGGGRIVRNMSEMTNSDENVNLLVADKNIEENKRIRRGEANQIYNETGIAIVEKDWIVDSLGKYSLKGIIDYLINDVECLYARKNDYSCLLMDND
ncbi:uncharacterized protein [Lepeophtheirus salmonis]|uniref:uncharacterized protein isoform X2 n=1 Tax=Lepeophtheirus salmonis TaxID=72036 RepID=UPI003AF3753B